MGGTMTMALHFAAKAMGKTMRIQEHIKLTSFWWGQLSEFIFGAHNLLIKRPGVAGAVLQTPSSLIDSFIHWVCHPFVQNLQDSVYPKP